MNRGVYIALLSIGLAQVLKIPIHFFRKKEFRPGLMFHTGGMPSSHSAGVASLTTFIALKRGIPTIDFALSLIYGLIVMYDAQGIRRQTGELTLKVNHMGEILNDIGDNKLVNIDEKSSKKLKEMLGHQPSEVIGGALLGIITGLIGFFLSKGRKKHR